MYVLYIEGPSINDVLGSIGEGAPQLEKETENSLEFYSRPTFLACNITFHFGPKNLGVCERYSWMHPSWINLRGTCSIQQRL